jgi:D-inositol-3-phosphate glycosyltransferase
MDTTVNIPLRVWVVDSTTGNDYALLLSSSLQNAGADVTLVTTWDRSQKGFPDLKLLRWSPDKRPRGHRVCKVVPYVGYLFKLITFAVRGRVDIIHYHFMRHEPTEFLCLPLLRLLRVHVVTTAHNIVPHERRLLDRFVRTVMFRSSHLIIAHSKFIKQQLIQMFRLPPDKIVTIPHGNFDMHLPDPLPSRAEARTSLALDPSDDILLFFGYIRPYKGLDLLLDAFEFAAAKNPRLKLLIAGAPQTQKMADHYEARIARISSHDRIVFHATYIDHDLLPRYFVAADIVMLPYLHIYHSGIVHLAYSFARPVIATRVGDFPECIEEGKTGFILDANNPKALAATIECALTDKSQLDDMGVTARTMSKTIYDWDVIGRQTASAYLGVITPSRES